jgi:magnesium transporter
LTVGRRGRSEGEAVRETVAGEGIGVERRTTVAGRAPAPVPGEAGAAWVDLLDPTPEQDRELLARLGVDLPTRAEMAEIESSSRAYEEGGVAYLTALVVCRTDGDQPGTTPVSFVLTPTHLVTVRFADLAPFRAFAARCARQPKNAENSAAAFAGLIEAIVDRTADVLERADAELAEVSAEVFRPGKAAAASAGWPRRQSPRDLDGLVERIGRHHDLLSTVRESLLTLQRVVAFARQAAGSWMPAEAKARLKTAERDMRSIMEHDAHLTQKAGFLLDATLGLINNQQNKIIKIFSVVAVVFMPPTLVASIYGMNFAHMPELARAWGYPASLALMALAAVAPYLYFKRRGWL